MADRDVQVRVDAAATRGAVLGWIVLTRQDGRWWPTGNLHQQRPAADQALHDALTGGIRAVLGEVTWVLDTPAIGGAL